jgi:hypothetical protein
LCLRVTGILPVVSPARYASGIGTYVIDTNAGIAPAFYWAFTQPSPSFHPRGAEIMKPVASASKDNYFDPLSSGSHAAQPQYLVAFELTALQPGLMLSVRV